MNLEHFLCELFFLLTKSKISYIYYSKLVVFNEKDIVIIISQNNIENIQTFHYDTCMNVMYGRTKEVPFGLG